MQFNSLKAVVFEFAESRSDQLVRAFFGFPGSDLTAQWTPSVPFALRRGKVEE
ncbi:hypothetical protein [Hydrogenophaga sp.]|uniref:hypothetical protein n=1 Tax=Hydrogenophaga sp. TaxID=1904254 RepID=UPI003F72B0C9